MEDTGELEELEKKKLAEENREKGWQRKKGKAKVIWAFHYKKYIDLSDWCDLQDLFFYVVLEFVFC